MSNKPPLVVDREGGNVYVQTPFVHRLHRMVLLLADVVGLVHKYDQGKQAYE
ncbi:MAG: hypothetical protein WBG62_22680 [Cyclobacteriaceae bacterium]